MSLFICSKCGYVFNTTTSDYWAVVHKIFSIVYVCQPSNTKSFNLNSLSNTTISEEKLRENRKTE